MGYYNNKYKIASTICLKGNYQWDTNQYHLRRWILLFPWKTTNPVAVKPRKAVEPVKSWKHTYSRGGSMISMNITPTQNNWAVVRQNKSLADRNMIGLTTKVCKPFWVLLSFHFKSHFFFLLFYIKLPIFPPFISKDMEM